MEGCTPTLQHKLQRLIGRDGGGSSGGMEAAHRAGWRRLIGRDGGGSSGGMEAAHRAGWRRLLLSSCGNAPSTSLGSVTQPSCLTETPRRTTSCTASGGMEAAAAEQLWKRSIDKFGFRYTTLLSDGDAKTYNQLYSKRVFGDTPIEK